MSGTALVLAPPAHHNTTNYALDGIFVKNGTVAAVTQQHRVKRMPTCIYALLNTHFCRSWKYIHLQLD
jgi:hypothetical protein